MKDELLIISAYTREAFKEYPLPSEKNRDFRLILPGIFFGLRTDSAVALENLCGEWRILPGGQGEIYKDTERIEGPVPLKSDDVYRIVTRGEEYITLLVKSAERLLIPYKKVMLLPDAVIRIGRSDINDIIYNNRDLVAREHALIRCGNGSCVIENASANGLYVNGSFLRTEQKLEYGDLINILGLHILYLGDILALDGGERVLLLNEKTLPEAGEKQFAGTLFSAKAGDRYFHRSPRPLLVLESGTVTIDRPPLSVRKETVPLFYAVGPSVTMVLPMLLGSAMMMYAARQSGAGTGFYLYSGLVMAGSAAAVGVFWALMNRRRQEKADEEAEDRRIDAYSSYLLEKKEELEEKYNRSREVMNRMYPCASACMGYSVDSPELWSRNPEQEDFLSCRVGLGDIPFQVNIETGHGGFLETKDILSDKPEMLRENFAVLKKVPVLVDLNRYRLIGAISRGDRKRACDLARLIMIQTAANNCCTDVKMILVYSRDDPLAASFWSFARWLPHMWSEDGKTRYIASERTEAGDIFFELTQILRKRVRDASKTGKNAAILPRYILFVSAPGLIEEEAIWGYVTEHPVECGVTTVFISDSYDSLPNTCEFFLESGTDFSGIYGASASNIRTEVEFDSVSSRECEAFSRRICGTRVRNIRGEGKIPASLDFFHMMGIKKPEDLQAKQRWLKNRTYENIRGCIGWKAGSAGLFLDIHEKYHGPHGLVAGMTGAGKSETLQTFILSLAVNYSPDDISFLLIDYKGGGLANQFEGLPHLSGSISNLSGSSTQRAMASIKSEVKRRQEVLGRYRVNHIDAYTVLYKNGECKEPVPHLIIVIDEFAELKKEEPDFMRELISVAQVGRSLGVHLILATQKPGGTVDENIRSNSRFRLCLRVQSRQDSQDMLGKADASELTGAGQCFFQVGNDEIYERFQSGYSGALLQEDEGKGESVRLIGLTGREVILPGGGRNEERDLSSAGKGGTQLEAVRDYLIETAAKNGYRKSRLLWLPPLPSLLCLEELKGYPPEHKETEIIAAAGKVDIPEDQSQETLFIRFPEAGHAAVCGTVVSGKSTFLQTLLYSLVTQYPPRRVNIYGIDCSGRAMEAFADAPHVGGIMVESDGEKMHRFFNMLASMAEKRKEAFRGGNFSEYLRTGGEDFPAIFLVIDNYAVFREKTGDAYENVILNISREGLRLGIYLVITTGGFGASETGSRLRENIRTAIVLGPEDRFACADIFRTMRVENMPSPGIRGRGLAVYNDRIVEFQTALSFKAEDDYERLEKIRETCRDIKNTWTGKGAERIPEIPEKPCASAFLKEEDVLKASASPNLLPVGYRQEDASICCVDTRRTPCYLVTGERRSGKKNFLELLLRDALMKKGKIFLVGTDDRRFRKYEQDPGIVCAFAEDKIMECLSGEIAALAEERKKTDCPVFVFITDFCALLQMACRSGSRLHLSLEKLFEGASESGIFTAAVLELDMKSQVQAYKAFRIFTSGKAGIHFGGRTIGNTLMNFDHLDYREQNRSQKPGTGLLPETDKGPGPGKIIVPLCEGQD